MPLIKIIIIGLNIVLMVNTVNISFGAEKTRICSYLFESLEQSEDWKTDITAAGWRQVDGQWYFFNQDGNYFLPTFHFNYHLSYRIKNTILFKQKIPLNLLKMKNRYFLNYKPMESMHHPFPLYIHLV